MALCACDQVHTGFIQVWIYHFFLGTHGSIYVCNPMHNETQHNNVCGCVYLYIYLLLLHSQYTEANYLFNGIPILESPFGTQKGHSTTERDCSSFK